MVASAPDTLSLEGKVAIVTGSGRENGIGAAIATTLARNGAKVVIHYVSDATGPRAAKVVQAIQELGSEAVAVQVDIRSPDAPSKLVQAALDAFKVDKIDILVNNAFGGNPSSLMAVTRDDFEVNFGTAVYGPIFLMQAVVPKMPQGGRIINISTVETKLALLRLPVYAASKAAMDSLSFALAFELGRDHGVTINNVLVGPVPGTDLVPPPHDQMAPRVLLPLTRAAERAGTVHDIADAVLLLASEKSRWITGQSISVSGGITGN